MMKKPLAWMVIILLLAAIACNAPTTSTEAPPTTQPTAEPTEEEAPTATTAPTTEPTAEPTEAFTPIPTLAPDTGFTTGNLENPNLPALPLLEVDCVDNCVPCGAAGPNQPGIVALPDGDEILICLFGYPTEGVNRVRLTSDGPAGSNFSTFYTSNGQVLDSDNIRVGRTVADSIWEFRIHIAAWYPNGIWTFSSQLNDGSLQASTTINTNVLNSYMTFTTMDPPPSNPFVTLALLRDVEADFYDADFVFPPGREVFIYGTNRQPNTTFTLALYRQPLDRDLGTQPAEGLAATTLTTDANGKWQTSYIFPEGALLRTYFFASNPSEVDGFVPDSYALKLRD